MLQLNFNVIFHIKPNNCQLIVQSDIDISNSTLTLQERQNVSTTLWSQSIKMRQSPYAHRVLKCVKMGKGYHRIFRGPCILLDILVA